MRRLLLATTALMAYAGTAQANNSPIDVNLGGSVEFRASAFNESTKDVAATGKARRGDFETIYEVVISAEGQTDNVNYGAFINVDNFNATRGQTANMERAYIWLETDYGKLVMGDDYGAAELGVSAPTLGLKQYENHYFTYFSTSRLAAFKPLYIDYDERFTKITYYSPKFGNENHKVQLGVSYVPDRSVGSQLVNATGGYNDGFEIAARYEGNFDDIRVTAAPVLYTAHGRMNKNTFTTRNFNAWGLGSQVEYCDFTLGGSYMDLDNAETRVGEDRDQHIWTVGLQYDGFKDIELVTNYLTGKRYDGLSARTYIDHFDALAFGGTYTWAPGMRTAFDVMFIDQNRADTGRTNKSNLFTISQKISF